MAHPYGQLQFELPGLPPLSFDEVIEQHLASLGSPHNKGEWDTVLNVVDAESRNRRASRIRWIEQLWNRLPEDGFGVVGGEEVLWLYYESTDAYAAELDVAAVLCSHAACERALAAYLEFRGALNKQLAKAGLGPVAKAAHQAAIIDARLFQELNVVTEVRKATAHFRPPLDPHSIHARWLSSPTSLTMDSEDVARSDAQQALTAATDLLLRLSVLPWEPPVTEPDASGGDPPGLIGSSKST